MVIVEVEYDLWSNKEVGKSSFVEGDLLDRYVRKGNEIIEVHKKSIGEHQRIFAIPLRLKIFFAVLEELLQFNVKEIS